MNKTLLLAGIATTLMAANAQAEDFYQYLSAKVSRTQMRNEASNKFLMKSGNDVVLKGTVIDSTTKDDVNGLRVAYGIGHGIPSWHGTVRAEVEYAINASSKESGNFDFLQGHVQQPSNGSFSQKMNINTAMLNLYYDYTLSDKLVPYVGIGGGLAHIKTTGNVFMPIPIWNTSYLETAKDTEDNFAWNLSTGLGYKITDHLTADLGYRYTNYGSIKNGSDTGSSSYKLDSHEINLGARYRF